jgi:hypothetical protein
MANLSDIVTSAFWRVNPPDDPAETRIGWTRSTLVQGKAQRAAFLLRKLLDHAARGAYRCRQS